MQFVKTPKHSASLVTTKGHYTNAKGKSTHHPRKSAAPVTFVGVDGEGVTINGEHRYVLFGVGDKQIENPSGLQWWEVFEFLYSQYKRGVAYVGFFLGYDFTQMFKTMPEDTAWMLLTSEGKALRKHRVPGKPPHPVQLDGWQFDILGMKRLRIRPKICQCEVATCKCKQKPWMYICDAGSFFQSSFLTVINPASWATGTAVVSDEEYEIIKTGKAARSTGVLDEDMRRYNRLENQILARVMGTLDTGFLDIGVHLPSSKWFGPGQAAQVWLKSQGVSGREEIELAVGATESGRAFIEAARMSYFGGWFEIFMHGIVKGASHEYDINSAYPHIISTLPCLQHGHYIHGSGHPTVNLNDICLVYASVWSPDMPDDSRSQHIGAMLHRDSQGRILRPKATEGWFWWHELKAAEKAGLVKTLRNSKNGRQRVHRWVKYTPCDCPPPMRGMGDLYQRRLSVGKDTPKGKAAKLVYNSSYGKFAQSVGEPIFGNPIYASLITSGCRTMILDAIATHPEGIDHVAMVATDAIYFITSHPKLTIGAELGAWSYKERTDLTLFKPGVYWDRKTREQILSGGSPSFKARGFVAADFASSIERIDREYGAWGNSSTSNGIGSANKVWPTVSFAPNFAMTTALQALRRRDWSQAGRVESPGKPVTQSANPSDKRTGLYRDDSVGVWRTKPYSGIVQIETEKGYDIGWVKSEPYTKRFGMEDPWSDEYKQQHGETPDGNVVDILAWLLKGE